MKKYNLGKFFSTAIIAITVTVMVSVFVTRAFTGPSANPSTGGGAIQAASGAPANSIYINGSGNVGIGTASPNQKLSAASSTGISIDATGGRMVNLGTPTASTDAATKAYVDAAAPTMYIVTDQWLTNSAPAAYCPSGWTIVTSWSSFSTSYVSNQYQTQTLCSK